MKAHRIIHFIAFAFMGFFLSLAIEAGWPGIKFVTVLTSLSVGGIFGAYTTLDPEIPLYKKIGTGYRMLVSVFYVWAGAFGLFSDSTGWLDWPTLLNAQISNYLLIPPFAFFHGLYQCTTHFYCTTSNLVWSLGNSTSGLDGLGVFSAIELGVGIVAVVAAYFLASRRWAGRVWIGVLVLAVASTLANLVVDQINARALPPEGHAFDLLLRSTLWALSYVVAYWATVDRGQVCGRKCT